jgi:iron(III) transport system substrate-binding protein
MARKWVILGLCLTLLLGVPLLVFGQDRAAALQKLYEAAKKEGKLVIHDGGTIEEITPIIREFERKYPGISVQAIVQPQPTIAQRIIMESQAGKLSIDVGRSAIGAPLLQLNSRGLLRKLDLTKVIDVDPANVWAGGILHVQTSVVPCLIYNTDLIPKGEEPKTWEDLLSPKWKGGKIYLSSFGIVNASMFFTRRESDTVEYLKKLKNQEIVIKVDPRACTADVSSGEAYIGETFARVYIAAKQRGAPVDLAPIGPQMYIPDGTFVMNGAPHPNAAELWTAWRQTPEGRDYTFRYANEAPEIKCTNCPSAQALCDKGIKFRVLQTVEDARLRGEYQEKVQDLLGMKPKK